MARKRPAEYAEEPIEAPGVNAREFLYDIQGKKRGDGDTSGLADDRKNVLDLNILVCVDVSGSISPTQFKQFMQQVDAIRGLSRVRVMEIDTDVVALYDYFKMTGGRVIRLGGGGGTAFSKGFDRAERMKPDAILFMTDGFVGDQVADRAIPTGWVLTHNGRKPYNFGTVVVRLPGPRH
jgi:predicted metal-dependent peptidase